MRIIGQMRLHEFCATHADCRNWIANWVSDIKGSHWKNFHDIKNKYPTASFLVKNIVIFNVRGNEYRLETQITFGVGVIAVLWIGTHAEYSRRYR